ncbi:MAG: MlaE family lipid ABC transporter permease subunit [Rhodoferax sp.]|uniref:ABC transporter permease n=1 Tax=Rhodoferax sp. TaxID=50421 RepID=UPI00272EFC39|nr:MlaE family lipid ABC transporter permease subunit [Rhodoferax sp.]MDP1530208.1 MlaE family lipid ABC transporter permease subunit [Rhodoferax sp.]MDP1943446.1 MlaE family lipid ABC transporter permease subunit [Rhodoferax sp.]
MRTHLVAPAAVSQTTPQVIALTGCWTARGLGERERDLLLQLADRPAPLTVDASGIEALDTAGAWVLHALLSGPRGDGSGLPMQGLPAEFGGLLESVRAHAVAQAHVPVTAVAAAPSGLESAGRAVVSMVEQFLAMLSFIGESAQALVNWLLHPSRIRWRAVLFNLRSAGFDALPIVGLLSFLLGVVVAYQGADQLRQYGANIFVADLVGLSMLREFAPLITAIIVAGRSGSAYAAQIGTMAVTEEIDAMRTLGLAPQELLVLPKVLALVIALPLLTVFADVMGILGGMMMAKTQLDVGFGEFLDRLVKAVSITSYLVGIGKAPVFAAIIVMVGCFQGFRTHGGADSVGRQTTRSVVQSIFLVIVADALFSVAFSLLDL